MNADRVINKSNIEMNAFNESGSRKDKACAEGLRMTRTYVQQEVLKRKILTHDQQVVLDYLKGICPPKLGVSAMVTAYCLVDDNINDNWQEYSDEIPEHIEALQKLTIAEENQVLQVFASWALEQGEE